MEHANEFAVYPNPATNHIVVKTTQVDGIFELYDLTGRRVMRFAILDYTTRVDISELASGTYYYRVKGMESNNGKIIVE
jgi:hypothetical protein